MAVLAVDSVTYHYPHTDRPALHDVSFEVQSGEFVAIVGANGSGKSTLCYLLTGFIPHFFQGTLQGRVTVAGLDTQKHPLEDIVLVSGLVSQNPANQISGARFTVYEEVAFGLENLGVPRDEMRPRIDRVLAMAGISELGDRSPFTLSGGEQQRVVLAAAFVMEPLVLVLDEPTSQLDPIGTRQVFAAIHEMSRQGMTVVMTEHKLEWVAAFADRVFVLAEGRLVLSGPPEDVLTSPLMDTYHVGQTRYTRAARCAQVIGLWPDDQPLPLTLEQAEAGFRTVLGLEENRYAH